MGTIFHLDIVSAEESIYSGPVEFIVAPAQMGEVGIYPHHTPMLTKIKSGMVRIKTQLNDDELVYVSGGMLEVQPDTVTILADTALRSQDLDEAKAIEAKKAADPADILAGAHAAAAAGLPVVMVGPIDLDGLGAARIDPGQ
ncbi:MAG: F0F1 ATP synthase subunit epsilon [Ilumatobacteraceae bacterium]